MPTAASAAPCSSAVSIRRRRSSRRGSSRSPMTKPPLIAPRPRPPKPSTSRSHERGRGDWLVRRARMKVEAFPHFGEPISVRTFCSATGRLAAERRTSVSGGGGGVEAVAMWIHVDPETLRPLRLGEEFQAVYGESAGSRKANFRLGHPDPPADPTAAPWRFRASDTDMAGHVNNAAYWEPVEELFAQTGEPESVDLEIEFREPAQPGDAQILRAGPMMWVTGT